MAYYLNYNQINDTLSVGTHSRFSNLITLFESYEEKGYDKNRASVTIGNSGFTFCIETNFGYGQRSYLRFKAEYNGSVLYCFQSKSGEYSHATPSPYFNVEPDPENWDKLFDLLCHVYKSKESWNVNECLKWQEVRIANPILNAPSILTKSFCGFVEMLATTGIASLTPIMEKTEIIISKDLPILSQIIIKEDRELQHYELSKQGIKKAFEFLFSIDRLEFFLKALHKV